MKALVTGATGFLGGYLARELHRRGWDVTATGRSLERGAELEAEGIAFRASALDDRETMLALCEGQEVIFHCGALSSAWGRKEAFWAANVTGTSNIVDGAKAGGAKRLVHVSTPAVYFSFEKRLGVKESDPLPPEPVNLYAASKLAAEEVVRSAVAEGLNAVIIRPRAIFGPGDTAIFPRLLRNIESGRFKIIGDESATLDLTFIDNCVEACILAGTVEGLPSGRVYNITDGEETQLWPLLRHISASLGYDFPTSSISAGKARTAARVMEFFHRNFRPDVEPLLTQYAVGILSGTLTLDISRAREELGYNPSVSTMEGVARFLAHLKQQG